MMVKWLSSSHGRGALLAGCIVGIALSSRAAGPFPPDQIEFFEKSVRPLLAERCHSCHGAAKHQNGLRLDSRAAVIRGSDYEKVVVEGNPAASKLIQAVKRLPNVEAMPKKGDALAAEQIAALEKWISLGLPWPEEKTVAAHSHDAKPSPQKHWAFLPVRKLGEFGVEKIESGIDELVQKKLKAAGLDFAPAADPAALCRRIHITLTGLPPSYEEVRAFVRYSNGTSKSHATHESYVSHPAISALVDKLLVSPRYGERWGRHWLDVARYSDTEGYTAGGKDNRYPYAWTYRDWVIQALNDDMPYDQFITLQLAADKIQHGAAGKELGAPARSEFKNLKSDIGSLAALGFLTVNDSFLGDRLLQTDDRIDVVTRGLMGITAGCARCHDHKYDPIPSKDYYALYSVFNSSTEPDALPIIGEAADKPSADRFKSKVTEVEGRMRAFRQAVFDDSRKADRLRDYLLFANQHRDMPDTAFRGEAGKAMLRDRIADKWRDFLNRHAFHAKPHPVMLAWKEFASVPQDEFAGKAAAIAGKHAKPEGGSNAVLRNELARRAPPKSLSDVASLYADVFLTCLGGKEPENDDWRQVKSLLMDRMSPMSVPVEAADQFFTRKDREQFTKLENEIKKLELNEPGAPLRAMVMLDKPRPDDVRIMIRGNPGRQGEPAPRGFLSFLGGQKFSDGSGRLELAKLIASRDNPLTARVVVNRVWMLHFGKPLVSQPSDFGVQTPKPYQAELLDFLAAYLMENGWSLKKLHKLILASRTYQQSCESTSDKDLKDAENNLLSRFNRQRLDYETMRDAMLLATGSLDLAKTGGRSTPLSSPEAAARRSVYLFVDRYEQPTVPAMFDFANPDTHSPQRFVTTVPQQSLFLMNSPFMRERAESGSSFQLAPQKLQEGQAGSLPHLYRRILARDPTAKEIEVGGKFLADAKALQSESAFVWTYGTMRFKQAPDGKTTFADWKPFTVLNEKHKSWTWSHTGQIPDPQWHYAMWHPDGGHAASGDIAPALRWTSPFNGTIRIASKLSKPSEKGNGIRGWIVSGQRGILKEATANPASEQPLNVESLAVNQGEIITFAIGSEGDTNSDSFTWTPQIFRDGQLLTDAKRDFCGKDNWPLNRQKPQSPLAQLAQVLLMSNEFQFVD